MLQVTPDATSAKTHYVIVDAVGVTQSLKTDSRPLERQPAVLLASIPSRVGSAVDRRPPLYTASELAPRSTPSCEVKFNWHGAS